MANKRSIAWGIAQACHDAGATLIFNYQGERVKENTEELAKTFGEEIAIYPCDVTSDEEIEEFFRKVRLHTNRIDFVIHSVAFAPKQALEGHFVETTREQFKLALDVSAYSLVAVTREALPLMTEGGSVLTMSFLGSTRVIPHYNVMGVAKAALEASVRYLAADLGPRKIRVNALSAGPMNTLAARGISQFTDLLKHAATHSPLERNVEMKELGATGAFFVSDAAAATTGQVIYIDCGYCIMGGGLPGDPISSTS